MQKQVNFVFLKINRYKTAKMLADHKLQKINFTFEFRKATGYDDFFALLHQRLVNERHNLPN